MRILVTFSADGSRVLTVGSGTAKVWRVTWPGLLEYLQESVQVCLTPKQRTLFLGESSSQAERACAECERRLAHDN